MLLALMVECCNNLQFLRYCGNVSSPVLAISGNGIDLSVAMRTVQIGDAFSAESGLFEVD